MPPDRLVDAQGRTVRVDEDPGYPYESLTTTQVADIQRLRDRILRTYHIENLRLTEELNVTKRRLDQALSLFEEMGMDIDVMLTTREVFNEKSPVTKGCVGCLVDSEPHTCGFIQ